MTTNKFWTNVKEKFKGSKNDATQKWKDFVELSKEWEIQSAKEGFSGMWTDAKNTVSTLATNSKVKKWVKLPENDALCAQIAWYSYTEPENRPYQIGNYYLEPSYNTDFYCIYFNHQDKICIIWYRWTEVKEKRDLFSDAQIILWTNTIDPRVSWSLQLFDQVRKSHPEYKKWICWHSLWGTLCYIVAMHRNVDYCCVFNPWSAPNKVFILMLTDTLKKSEWTQKVHTYKILGDPISLCSYVWTTTCFFVPKWNPLKFHGMKNFVKGLVDWV